MASLGRLFSPKLPKPAPVVRMPDPLDPAVLEAQRKKRRELLESKGRESTNLTDGNDDVAAGSSYVADTLGS